MIDFGEGVFLAPFDSDGLGVFQHWRNDYSTWKYCRQNDLITDRQQKEWFERQSNDSGIKMYRIATEEACAVGVAGLTSIDWVNRRAEFSLYIAPEERGKGLAKAALKTLCSHGFRNLNLHSIWGETFDYNFAAIKLFPQLGFKCEGIRRDFYYKEGSYINAYLFSMLQREWASSDVFKKEQLLK